MTRSQKKFFRWVLQIEHLCSDGNLSATSSTLATKISTKFGEPSTAVLLFVIEYWPVLARQTDRPDGLHSGPIKMPVIPQV